MSRTRSCGLLPLCVGILCLLALSCTASSRSANEPAPVLIQTVPQPGSENAPDPEAGVVLVTSKHEPFQPSSDAVPVDADDVVWGAPNAPVTIVQFQDLQCPFCSRVQPTLDELEKLYARGLLRFVLKHNPLPFHKQAHEAARFTQAVRDLAGSSAARSFAALAFANQRKLGLDAYKTYLSQLRLDAREVERRAASPEVHARVEADMALAKRVGLNGTPSFLINGVALSGAQPVEKFSAIIGAELPKAEALASGGSPPGGVYAALVAKNFRSPEPASAPEVRPAADDLTAWKVPIAGAPSLGPKDALVTIVAFYDYQCPFCKRVQPALDEVLARYPADVRVVIRQNPLPFHVRGVPAAMLALEARAQKGDKGFFEMQQRLFERAPALEDTDLMALGAAQKLDAQRLKRALDKKTHQRILTQDMELAAELQARSVPHFFVNGVRLSGAQPVDKFVEAVERERERALALVNQGVPRLRVYAELQKTAKAPDAPEQKRVAAGIASPTRGPAKAAYVIEIFSDFQCPFCKRVNSTLADLEARYPGQIRWVFRNLPLPFHDRARAAAALSLEARAQKGNAAFWTMHDALFEAQSVKDGLSEAGLLDIAAKQGLDLDKVRAALAAGGPHDAAIDADLAAASTGSITGTPAFVVNGYFLSGAQPALAFERVMRYSKAHPVK